jgi:hypothetical protein
MPKPPSTLHCPSCGNINPYGADACLKCGLNLKPVRDLLSGRAAKPAEQEVPQPKPKSPVPPLPSLHSRPSTQEIGNYVDSLSFLIRGMGDRADEIAARFFKRLNERSITGLRLSIGKLIIPVEMGRTDSRNYYFAERDLGKDALATMALRIASVGTDLFVEWSHYTTPPLQEIGPRAYLQVFA